MYLFIHDFLPGCLLLSLVQSAMSRNSFEELMRYLHVNGNSSLDTDDRMNRVPPLMTLSNKTFLSFFKVLKTQNITFHPLQSSQDPNTYFSPTSKFSRPKHLVFHLLQSSLDPNTLFFTYFKTQTPSLMDSPTTSAGKVEIASSCEVLRKPVHVRNSW